MEPASTRDRLQPDTVQALRTDKAALLYFSVVFGFGFLFGAIRTFFVEPKLGTTTAELLELPLMILVIFLVASWVVRRVPLAPVIQWCTVGAIALCLLLLAEALLITQFREQSVAEYFSGRDVVSTGGYLIGLTIFAVAPAAFAALRNRRYFGTETAQKKHMT